MGGDFGPSVVVPAAVSILGSHDRLQLILVGDRPQIEHHLRSAPESLRAHIRIHHTTEVVAMHDLPSQALRTKKDSSMRVAINLVKEGQAQACVSAGNTGALMATARYVLKTLPGIDRPAIITTLPTMTGHTRMLDLGANVNSSAEQLFQFAVMGAVLASAVGGNEQPRVGLLNIGEEEIKGNEQVKQAHAILARSPLNYVGYIEGGDIYKGAVDVVVCDGFVGNVALKTSEGVATMLLHFIKQAFRRSPMTKLAGWAALPVLKQVLDRMDHRRYNGASLIGLQGIVIKSHGSADTLAFANAVTEALHEVEQAVPQRIGRQLESLLVAGKTA